MQADGRGSNKLKRIAIQIQSGDNTEKDDWYYFKINPAEYSYSKPQRSTVIKTKSNIVVEDFGKDIETIAFSGTTGFKKDSKGHTGEDRLRNLEDVIDRYAQQTANGNSPASTMYLHNFTEDKSYVVHLGKEGLTITRSEQQPLLFNYSLSLVVLRGADVPDQREVQDPELGNTQGTASNTQSNSQAVPLNPNDPTQVYNSTTKSVNNLKKQIGYQ